MRLSRRGLRCPMVRADARTPFHSLAMLSRTEIAHGVSGAWRLMWGDGGGLYMLDRTIEGFWRSFRVAILIAPLQVLCSMIDYERVETVAPDSLIVLVEALRYIIAWTAFPVLLLEIARRFGWSARYIGAVVAMNWANVPVTILWTMVAALGGIAPSWLVHALSLLLTGLSVYWVVRILRGSLSIGIGQAIALALLALWLGITLMIIVRDVLGVMPGSPA